MRQQGKKSAAQVVGVALTGNIAAEPLVAQVRSERGGVVVEGVFVCVCVYVCVCVCVCVYPQATRTCASSSCPPHDRRWD